jgi:hypothetical protein
MARKVNPQLSIKPIPMSSENSKPTDPGVKAAAPAAPEVAPAAPEAAPVAPAAPAAAPVAEKPASRYRVKTQKSFSLHGQIVTWHVGDVVEVSSYGLDGIKRAIDAGVELEKF